MEEKIKAKLDELRVGLQVKQGIEAGLQEIDPEITVERVA